MKVVGRLVPHANGCTSAPHSPLIALERPLPGQFDVTRTPNHEGDDAKIVSSAGSNTMQISGDNVSPPYHHVHARKSSSPVPAYTNLHRHEAPFAQENFKCPSTRCACQVEHDVRVRSPVHVVGLVGSYTIFISFIVCQSPSHYRPGFLFYLHASTA